MSITIYKHRFYGGSSKQFTEAVADLGWFKKKISSLKIVGDPWVLYEHPNFRGKSQTWYEGDHDWVGGEWNDVFSSMQPLRGYKEQERRKERERQERQKQERLLNEQKRKEETRRGLWASNKQAMAGQLMEQQQQQQKQLKVSYNQRDLEDTDWIKSANKPVSMVRQELHLDQIVAQISSDALQQSDQNDINAYLAFLSAHDSFEREPYSAILIIAIRIYLDKKDCQRCNIVQEELFCDFVVAILIEDFTAKELHTISIWIFELCYEGSLLISQNGQKQWERLPVLTPVNYFILILWQMINRACNQGEDQLCRKFVKLHVAYTYERGLFTGSTRDLLYYLLDCRQSQWGVTEVCRLYGDLPILISDPSVFEEILKRIRSHKLLPFDVMPNGTTIIDMLSSGLTCQDIYRQMIDYKELNKEITTILKELKMPEEVEEEMKVAILAAVEQLTRLSRYPEPNVEIDVAVLQKYLKRVVEAPSIRGGALTDALVLASLQVMHTRSCNGFWPREIQMVCFCALAMDQRTGSLLEIATGEGKSAIIAMVAAVNAMRGRMVDIVTSSPVLAKRDSAEWAEFYNSCGVSVAHNFDIENRDKESIECLYKCQIVYGTVGSFAGDILRTNFELQNVRQGRPFHMVIVDEVDSMLIDQGVQLTYLSHSVASSGLRHLEPSLALVWSVVSNYRPIAIDNGQLVYRGRAEPFYTFIFQAVQNLAHLEGPHDIMQLAQLTIGICPEVSTWASLSVEDIGNELRVVSRKQLISFLEVMPDFFPLGFDVYEINERGEATMATHIQVAGCQSLSILVLDGGQLCMLTQEEVLNEYLAEDLRRALPSSGARPSKEQLDIPEFLLNYAHNQLETWITNAFMATRMREGREYVVENGEVLPVDYHSTGVIEINKRWGGGLQQFLEMKHRLTTNVLLGGVVGHGVGNCASRRWGLAYGSLSWYNVHSRNWSHFRRSIRCHGWYSGHGEFGL